MSVTKAELTGLYLSYFGRPPDPGGLDYYLAQPDATVVSVAAAFSVSPESLALLGPVFGAAQVDSIYMNLFGRHAEPDGLSYWVGQVSSGALSPAMAAYGIFLGAQNDDKISVQNKMAIATLFTAHLDTPDEIANYNAAGAESAREFLALVGSSAQSLA